MSLGQRFWQLRYPGWPPPEGPLQEGYTVLVPVPGDLPALAELAINVLGKQHADHRLSTVFIPDQPSPAVERIVQQAARTWQGPLSVERLALPERWFLHRLRSASRIHWLQVVTGMSKATARYALLHDADLFLLDHDVIEQRFRIARDNNLACLGVNPVWDGWYASKGRSLVATWEMMASVEWFRSFGPNMHGPHDGLLWGETHTFDTTLHPQALTDQGRIACEPIAEGKMVNFNYAIATYRMFQKAREPFLDEGFRLLLLRVLVDVYAGSCDVPPLETLAQSLGAPANKITFPDASDASVKYGAFRDSLASVLRSELVPSKPAERVEGMLGPFDKYYSWSEQ